MGKKSSIILYSLLGIVINILVGHYFAPLEMLTTIFVLPIISIYIYRYLKIGLIYKMLCICLFIIMNDLGVKVLGGGHHDQIGQFLINTSSIIGVCFTYTVLLASTAMNRKEDTLAKQVFITILILFPLTQVIYFLLSWNIGLGVLW